MIFWMFTPSILVKARINESDAASQESFIVVQLHVQVEVVQFRVLDTCSSIKMSAEQHYGTASELIVEEDYAGAVEEFNKALAADSTFVKALTGRSSAYSKLNKHKEALQVCDVSPSMIAFS